jgi:hypothetical protein
MSPIDERSSAVVDRVLVSRESGAVSWRVAFSWADKHALLLTF